MEQYKQSVSNASNGDASVQLAMLYSHNDPEPLPSDSSPNETLPEDNISEDSSLLPQADLKTPDSIFAFFVNVFDHDVFRKFSINIRLPIFSVCLMLSEVYAATFASSPTECLISITFDVAVLLIVLTTYLYHNGKNDEIFHDQFNILYHNSWLNYTLSFENRDEFVPWWFWHLVIIQHIVTIVSMAALLSVTPYYPIGDFLGVYGYNYYGFNGSTTSFVSYCSSERFQNSHTLDGFRICAAAGSCGTTVATYVALVSFSAFALSWELRGKVLEKLIDYEGFIIQRFSLWNLCCNHGSLFCEVCQHFLSRSDHSQIPQQIHSYKKVECEPEAKSISTTQSPTSKTLPELQTNVRCHRHRYQRMYQAMVSLASAFASSWTSINRTGYFIKQAQIELTVRKQIVTENVGLYKRIILDCPFYCPRLDEATFTIDEYMSSELLKRKTILKPCDSRSAKRAFRYENIDAFIIFSVLVLFVVNVIVQLHKAFASPPGDFDGPTIAFIVAFSVILQNVFQELGIYTVLRLIHRVISVYECTRIITRSLTESKFALSIHQFLPLTLNSLRSDSSLYSSRPTSKLLLKELIHSFSFRQGHEAPVHQQKPVSSPSVCDEEVAATYNGNILESDEKDNNVNESPLIVYWWKIRKLALARIEVRFAVVQFSVAFIYLATTISFLHAIFLSIAQGKIGLLLVGLLLSFPLMLALFTASSTWSSLQNHPKWLIDARMSLLSINQTEHASKLNEFIQIVSGAIEDDPAARILGFDVNPQNVRYTLIFAAFSTIIVLFAKYLPLLINLTSFKFG